MTFETFEDLQGITIFEIPIYAFSPEDHRRRCIRKFKSDTKKFLSKGFSAASAENCAEEIYKNSAQWKYNKLVGMFCLTVKNNDPFCENALLCHLYCNKKFPGTITSYSSLPFRNQYLVYERIYLRNITNDKELVAEIKEKIEILKNQHGIKNSYFDCTALDNMISLTKIQTLLHT
ncbi:MAG: hypothetical protein IJP23_03345 [Oscillospiraceae bacterium]|nr:hypothetical protein [Oscillospiraceae bacterium]